MNSAAAQNESEQRIRVLARDGWTYAGIAGGMLLLSAGAAAVLNKFRLHYDELATFAGVGLACGVVCGLLSTFRLYQAGVIARIARWLLRLLWGMRLYFLLGIVSAATFFLFANSTVRAAAVAFTPALLFGGGVLAVTQWWRGVRLKPRKHALLRVLLAAPVFYLLACGAEFYVALHGKSLAGTSVYGNFDLDQSRASMRFCRTLPAAVRRLVWDQLKPQTYQRALVIFGFPPEDVLEADCKKPLIIYSYQAAFGWYVAAPEAALEFALAVPETPVNPNVDRNAGMLVGYVGSVEQVRAKFSGQHSQDYLDGLSTGIWLSKRNQMFAPEYRDLITRGYNSRTLWYIVMRVDWEFTYETIRAMAASADTESLPKLNFALRTITDVELALEIAESPHPSVRVLLLPLQFKFDPRWIGALIRIAEGKMPNPDPLERRTAATTLTRFTQKMTESFKYNTKPGIAPLIAQEEADIQEIVNEAHKRIGATDTRP